MAKKKLGFYHRISSSSPKKKKHTPEITFSKSHKENYRIDVSILKKFAEYLIKTLELKNAKIYVAGSMSPLSEKLPTKNSDIDFFIELDVPFDDVFSFPLFDDDVLKAEVLFFGETFVHLIPFSSRTTMFKDDRQTWLLLAETDD